MANWKNLVIDRINELQRQRDDDNNVLGKLLAFLSDTSGQETVETRAASSGKATGQAGLLR